MTRDPGTGRLQDLAQDLAGLHEGEMLVLPNAWDAASARAVEEAGFPVVATTSAAVSATLGFPDGQAAPWEVMFAATARIAGAVQVPVTMDAESGYGMTATELVERLLEAGVVGCNLEDTEHAVGGLREAGLREAGRQADWLAAVRSAADDAGVPLVINARTDVFLPVHHVPEQDRVEEAVARGLSYRQAGADCVYPIGVQGRDDLGLLVSQIGGPINANSSPDLTLPVLRTMGVARVSYGPRFHREALAGFASAIRAL